MSEKQGEYRKKRSVSKSRKLFKTVEKFRQRFRRTRAKIPPMMPSSIPAMKPPPIIRLKIANGKTMTSASAPLLSAMTIAPSTSVRPMIAPTINAYAGPITGSQKNVDDQRAQNDGDSRAAAFNKTSMPDSKDTMTAIVFLPFETRPETSPVGGGARTTCGLPQKGQ